MCAENWYAKIDRTTSIAKCCVCWLMYCTIIRFKTFINRYNEQYKLIFDDLCQIDFYSDSLCWFYVRK